VEVEKNFAKLKHSTLLNLNFKRSLDTI